MEQYSRQAISSTPRVLPKNGIACIQRIVAVYDKISDHAHRYTIVYNESVYVIFSFYIIIATNH